MEYTIKTHRNIGDEVYVIEGYRTLKGVVVGVESTATCKGDDLVVETKYLVEMENYRCTSYQKSIFTKDELELYTSLNEVAEDILDKHGIRSIALDNNLFRVIRLNSDEYQRMCED